MNTENGLEGCTSNLIVTTSPEVGLQWGQRTEVALHFLLCTLYREYALLLWFGKLKYMW